MLGKPTLKPFGKGKKYRFKKKGNVHYKYCKVLEAKGNISTIKISV